MDDRFADDAVLVPALQAGDEAAFEWLLDTYSARLHRLARAFVHTAAAAEEVVQETWLAVIAGISRFEGRAAVKTWIYRILMNQARRRGTRDRRSIAFGGQIGEDEPTFDRSAFLPPGHEWAGHWASPPADWEHQPEDRLTAAETLAVVRQAIDELTPVPRQVILLRDVEGWSGPEVCELLGLTEANQRVLLHRARAHVRRRVETHLEETTP